MRLQLSRDKNGNKTLKVSFSDGTRGFSVQTLGNLPEAHKMSGGERLDGIARKTADSELFDYIAMYGTNRQKHAIGV